MKKLLLLNILSLVLLAGCYNDKAEYLYPPQNNTTCDTTNVSFATVIKPIFDNYCNNSGCHDNGTKSSNVALDTYDDAKTATQNGSVICSIEWGSTCSPMPKDATVKLSDCNILKIKTWASNNFPQ